MFSMKQILWHMLVWSGLAALARRRARDQLTIVLYHGVDEKRDMGSYNYRGKFLTPERFEEHLRYYKRHYSVLPLDKAVALLVAGKNLPPYTLCITFDDGYANNYTYAFPLLRQYDLPATFFLTSDFVLRNVPLWVDRLEYSINMGTCCSAVHEKVREDDRERARLKRLPHDERMRELEALEERCGIRLDSFEGDASVYAPLTREQIGEMRASGMMMGAHTESHPILGGVDPKTAEREILGSKEKLAATCGTISSVFAYPNGQPGDQDETIAKIVKQSGFIAAVTTVPGFNAAETDPYMLNRMSLDQDDDHARLVVSLSGFRHQLHTVFNHYAKRD